MTLLGIGVAIGLMAGLILHSVSMGSYKRVLVMKAEDGSAEHINGKFYRIVKE